MNSNNKSDKFINLFKILYEKDLSSIPMIKRKKKKKNKNSKINKSEKKKIDDENGPNIKKKFN